MAERIELPATPTGTPEQQMAQLYSYLYRMAETMNLNLEEIGSAALTDEEQVLMNQLAVNTQTSQTDPGAPAGFSYQEQQTLKGLIIKTADFVKTSLDAYRMVLFGETQASGQFGDYRLKQGLRVDVNPEGIKQTYSFAEVVKGLKTYEINAKNYIKTGYLRTENSIPIYGVAIGKDVVTFSEDGTETYNDGNKVAELTADQLTFFHSGNKMASFNGTEVAFYVSNAKVVSLTASALTFYQNSKVTAKFEGNRIGFYNNGTEYMYITGGKIYTADDMYIGSGKNVFVGDWRFNKNGLIFYSGNSPKLQFGRYADKVTGVEAGVYVIPAAGQYDPSYVRLHAASYGYNDFDVLLGAVGASGMCLFPSQSGCCLGAGDTTEHRWTYAWIWVGHINNVYYDVLSQNSSRDIKHDIQPMESMGDRLDQLQPATFVYDRDPEEKKRFGLIYEDTVDVMPEICTNDEGNKAINYVEMIPMMLKEIQDLRKRVSDLERRE